MRRFSRGPDLSPRLMQHPAPAAMTVEAVKALYADGWTQVRVAGWFGVPVSQVAKLLGDDVRRPGRIGWIEAKMQGLRA